MKRRAGGSKTEIKEGQQEDGGSVKQNSKEGMNSGLFQPAVFLNNVSVVSLSNDARFRFVSLALA